MTACIGRETWLFEGDIKRRRGESKTEWNRLESQRKRIENTFSIEYSVLLRGT